MMLIFVWFICGHTWQVKSSYQSVHSTAANVYAIITLKNVSNLVGAETFVVVGINLEDQSGDLLILFGTISRLRFVMLIVSASIDVENSANSFNIVLETELMNSL